MSTSIPAREIAQLVTGCQPFSVDEPQTIHRLAIVDAWKAIKADDKILELGCGQGDMTAVLASLIGPTGHVVALDPADPVNYGSPWTLQQAQDHLSASHLGPRIEWVHSDTMNYLEKSRLDGRLFDSVILAHSLWYFASPKVIDDTLVAIRKLAGSPKLLIAEYALESQHAEGLPHVLAALTQAALEAHKPESTSNIRTIASPRSLRETFKCAGWNIVLEEKITPDVAYQDGRWEVGMVIDEAFLKEVDQIIMNEREKSTIIALRDSMIATASRFQRNSWRSMDVWVAVFK